MTDIRNFRLACHTAARRVGGEVVEFRLADDVTPNFHQALITYRDRTVAVVCTRDSAILAVAEPRTIQFVDDVRDSGPLTFVDVPALMAVLAELPGFEVLPPSELNGPFDPADWPDVRSDDMKYWRPGNLGEALFNYWD
ncbi:hypothetical protein H4696_006759 [Amycolatopsis lexingtonensis]|uniref:Uncharacterized protein n=1 Tax=Amycolatopsis lexingtonensis TaxID=218822 RepID=A0ABR9I903_9PSEU|nr:hypothetical protein [Amycolatopsis lexingtonensis]MBE1499659.1 hypothetical protein [Amycolatopsis lexingtonensis]